MKLADFFQSVSQWAESLAIPLIGRQQANLAKLGRLNALEERLARMEADGVIDPAEGAEMVRLLKAEGLSTNEIEGLMAKLGGTDTNVIGNPSNRFADAVKDRLDDRRVEVDEDAADTQIALNKLHFEYNHHRELASQVQASGHKADMNVIANMKA